METGLTDNWMDRCMHGGKKTEGQIARHGGMCV